MSDDVTAEELWRQAVADSGDAKEEIRDRYRVLLREAGLPADSAAVDRRDGPQRPDDHHLVTIGSSFLEDTYSVSCSCGFEVDGLATQLLAALTGADHQAAVA